jgi:hypothetical protein
MDGEASRAQRAFRIQRFVMHGEHEQRKVGVTSLDILNQFQPVSAL